MVELIKALILPSHLTAILLLFGLVLFATRRFRRTGTCLLSAGTIMYLVFSNGVVAASLIGPLEYRYPPLLDLEDLPDAATAILLTSYAADDPSIPLSSRGGTSTVYRILEVSRLYKSGRVANILVSGDPTAVAIMAELLVLTGVPNSAIEVDNGASDTNSSALRAQSRVSSSTVLLVTSAGHMPRAVNVFNAAGMNVIPSPTDHKLPSNAFSASMMPSGFHLDVSDLAVHEYLALAWYRLSGRTDRYW